MKRYTWVHHLKQPVSDNCRQLDITSGLRFEVQDFVTFLTICISPPSSRVSKLRGFCSYAYMSFSGTGKNILRSANILLQP